MNNQKGLTLIEMMVVIGIIGILAGIAIPNAISWRSNAQLSSTAREIMADLQRAKTEAIKRNTDIEAVFTTGKGAKSTIAVADTSPQEIVKDGPSYSGGAEITSADSVRFNSRGLPVDNAGLPVENPLQIQLTNGQRSTSVEVSVAGNIRIQP